MPEQTPLYLRLYQQAPMIELVRGLGYRDVPLKEGQEIMKGLIEKFGKDVMKAASEELTEVKIENGNEIARLKPHVRKLAHQLLGPDPNVKTQTVAEFLGLEKPNGEPIPPGKSQNGDSRGKVPQNPPERPKRTRKKKSDTVPPAESASTDVPAKDVTAADSASPFMTQYREAKERHPGMLLLFRMGDFYEMFEGDAEEAAKLLGLTLTSKDGMSMSGFPYHQLEVYLRKLLKEGVRVAVCDQVDSGIKSVRREVTRVLVPGTLSDDREGTPPDTGRSQKAAS